MSGPRPAGRLQPGVLLAVAAGGALGSPARYALEEAFPAPAGAFPAATFAINVSGAFALGLFVIAVIERFPPSRYLRPFVATGLLGAYTTFSTSRSGSSPSPRTATRRWRWSMPSRHWPLAWWRPGSG